MIQEEKEKMRIGLFILPLLTQGGGAEKYFIELARNLRERGNEADVVTMDEKFFCKFARLLRIFVLGNFFGRINMEGRESEDDIKILLGQARWIKTNFKNLGRTLRNYDIIYSRNELAELVLLKMHGFRNLPPIVIGVHTPIIYHETSSFISKLHNFLYKGFFYKVLLRGVKCIHTSNVFTKEYIENNYKIKCKMIYYPFSADEIAISSKKYDSGLDFEENKFNIAFVGRLSEQKGMNSLAKIVKLISDTHNNFDKIQINIFGSGTQEHENIVKDLEKRFSFVTYFGHVENKYIPNILSKQNLLISTSKWETLPYNILEAQALGLPVIAFDIPGPRDIIENRKTGFLVKNEKEFFDKVIALTEGKVNLDREIIVTNIENKFNPGKIYSELINMLREFANE